MRVGGKRALWKSDRSILRKASNRDPLDLDAGSAPVLESARVLGDDSRRGSADHAATEKPDLYLLAQSVPSNSPIARLLPNHHKWVNAINPKALP
jgi:hypothetical protein